MSTALEVIKAGKGIQSIVRHQGRAQQQGQAIDWYEIAYYTRGGNVAIVEGTADDVADILAHNASLRPSQQKRIQIR